MNQAIAGRFTKLYEDETGLYYEAETIPTTVGRDLATELRSGVLHNMSIQFDALREEYDKEANTFTVLESRLFEISPVLWGAYENSTVANVRNASDIMPFLEHLTARELRPEHIGQLTLVRAKINEILNTDDSEPGEPLGAGRETPPTLATLA